MMESDEGGLSQAEMKVQKELSWLEIEDVKITFPHGSGWILSPASISRRFLVDNNIVLPVGNLRIREDSLIKDGDVEPVGLLKLDIILDRTAMPKDISVSAR